MERSEKAVLVAELSDMKQKLSKQEASSSKAVSEIKDQKQSIKVDLTRELDAYKVDAPFNCMLMLHFFA